MNYNMDEYTEILKKYYPVVKYAGEFYLSTTGWFVFGHDCFMEYIDFPPEDISIDEFEIMIVMRLL